MRPSEGISKQRITQPTTPYICATFVRAGDILDPPPGFPNRWPQPLFTPSSASNQPPKTKKLNRFFQPTTHRDGRRRQGTFWTHPRVSQIDGHILYHPHLCFKSAPQKKKINRYFNQKPTMTAVPVRGHPGPIPGFPSGDGHIIFSPPHSAKINAPKLKLNRFFNQQPAAKDRRQGTSWALSPGFPKGWLHQPPPPPLPPVIT